MRDDLIKLSYKRLLTLHPQLQASALKCYDACIKKDIPLYIVWGRRSFEEQDLLYRFGRDTPGKIYTYTRSELTPHCYGLAVEFCLYNDDILYEWPECENKKYWRWKWIKVMKIFEADGWTSGWRWFNYQPGHLENLLNKTMRQHKEDYEQADKDRYNWQQNL